MAKSPRVLIYDLETSHNIVAQFDIRDEYTPHTNVLAERFIICAAWKWLGESKVYSVQIDRPFDDLKVVKALHDVISQADVIVGHNGDQFDQKWVNTRILYHGLPALPPVASIDTLKVAKNRFRFNSNKLDYIANFLGLGRKIHTDPEMWLDILRGDKKALREMVTYNKKDVVLLEGVFKRLSAYMPNYVSRELFGGTGCPRCGSTKIQSRGLHRAISRVYRRWQCQSPSCMGWFKSNKCEPSSTKFRIL